MITETVLHVNSKLLCYDYIFYNITPATMVATGCYDTDDCCIDDLRGRL